MKTYYSNHPNDVKKYDSKELREKFLMEEVFIEDEMTLSYTHVDRVIFGGVMPVNKEVELVATKELAADYFLERREMGVINVGGAGSIEVDSVVYYIEKYDAMYISKGAKNIIFKSKDSENPAKFYMNSCPAHKELITRKISYDDAIHRAIGSQNEINKRVINQYIHPDVVDSCQLCMGFTHLEEGNAWNTMPCHTHERRMEVYFYFELDENDRVLHLMGEPAETRHIIMKNEQAVISPSWSIHSGVGTKSYTFIWGMCGENQEFDDMDHVPMSKIR